MALGVDGGRWNGRFLIVVVVAAGVLRSPALERLQFAPNIVNDELEIPDTKTIWAHNASSRRWTRNCCARPVQTAQQALNSPRSSEAFGVSSRKPTLATRSIVFGPKASAGRRRVEFHAGDADDYFPR